MSEVAMLLGGMTPAPQARSLRQVEQQHPSHLTIGGLGRVGEALPPYQGYYERNRPSYSYR